MTELYPAYWLLGASASATSNLSADDAPIFAIVPEVSAPSYHAVVEVPKEFGEYVL